MFTVEPIAYIQNDYKEKFGIPRQSGLENETISEIVFCEKYRDDNSLRGLEGFSHIWLLWIFTEAETTKDWTPTVRPPRLGGNKRMGVFSTRSPFHPNKIGLSCVKISSIEKTKDKGTVIKVKGADLMCGTPIIDIKPYLSFSDSYPEAVCGFAAENKDFSLEVKFDCDISQIPERTRNAVVEMLKQDPRPSYQDDESRIYSMLYGKYDVRFNVEENLVKVIEFMPIKNGCEK